MIASKSGSSWSAAAASVLLSSLLPFANRLWIASSPSISQIANSLPLPPHANNQGDDGYVLTEYNLPTFISLDPHGSGVDLRVSQSATVLSIEHVISIPGIWLL